MPAFNVNTPKEQSMLSIIKYSVAYYTSMLNRDRRAAGALEYALLVSFIAMVVIAGATLFGDALSGYFSKLSTAVGSYKATPGT
jgi:pilus assembly protein Flp/PilA